uniref:Coiled-coil and C2 domain containing 1B n=1 Tax=Poecilia reticulata TaxID=8081 RepID=A0A3P9PWZ3_POERE
MFGKKKKAPMPKGQGAAAAKQMGLFVDLNPEEMMGAEENLDDPDLEAELAAITGNKAAARGKAKPKGKSPLPMEDIAKMADECMRDMDEDDDDDNIEDDEDLLVGAERITPHVRATDHFPVEVKVSTAPPGSLQHTLEERAEMYKTAIKNAKSAGETSKARRYDRGLKTLESMIAAVKKGKPVNESEIPPPVATGAPTAAPRPAVPSRPAPPVPSRSERETETTTLPTASPDAVTPSSEEEQSSSAASVPTLSDRPSPEETPAKLSKPQPTDCKIKTVSGPAGPSAPKDVLEALEQRRVKYVEASNQAKASGDDRKARMHDRIAKQYQSAIRAHKAGKPVDFDELPVPPGFPPIPGQKVAGDEQGLVATLEAASKLASTDVADEDDDEKEEEVSFLAAQLLELLDSRKKQFMKAALQAKQKNDMDQAKVFLRTAKGLDPMIEAARSGKTVDISTLPSPPGDEEDDFILVHHSDVQVSEKAGPVYTQLCNILKEQHEKCLTYSKQFTHLGNVSETTKFEKLAESCKKSLDVLKLAQSRGLPPPQHHFEEKSFHTVRIFPELSSTDMVVIIVKGMNLPAPSGIQPNDLDAYIKFDFPYPSSILLLMSCFFFPEYNQSFTLSINRNHRGFRRLVASKGLKLELLHKGGFLRSDKPVGSALIKLDKLESQSEIREIVEVMDGRKHTGGRVEVKVRLREPLSGQDVQTSTERWLVIDSSKVKL